MENEKEILNFIKESGCYVLKSTEKDAQDILDVLKMIKERGYSVTRATKILEDVVTLLPMLAKL